VTIESNSPVKLTYRTMALRTVLRKFLGEYGLTYIIKDEAIYVTTAKRAREMMVTRVYYLGDLVAGVGTFGGGATWGPVIAREQMLENAKFITQLITSSIDPDSWSERGGGGSVTFHEPTMSLVIRQSAEVHAMIKGSMGGGLPK
jgi:hypothetical protein